MLALLLVEIALSLPEATAMTQVPVLPTLFTAVPMLQCCLFLAWDRVTVERNHLRARSLAEFALLSVCQMGTPWELVESRLRFGEQCVEIIWTFC